MKLKELREQRNISRERLAVDVGTSYANIVSLELGRSQPSLKLAIKIAEYFGVPVESIDWGTKPAADDDQGKGVRAEVA